MSKYVWVAYEKCGAKLPIAVADTACELSRIIGVSEACVSSTWSHFRNGRFPSSRFYRVKIEEDDME